MADGFKRGEFVDIAIKGVRVAAEHKGLVSIVADHPDGEPAHYAMPPQAKVTRVAPAEWPPRAGDLWRDCENDVWFAVEDSDGEITMVCQVDACPSRSPSELIRTLSPLAFVYREDEQDGENRG
ncbi:hypothetical protein [Actinomadura sp. WMMA1423]|uniref:hypothetical protein n=1 Tax=Actinomadura sp. WMMA1423 TaxID=2591108 RepID=UPI0011471CC5|nr:hypothetical protein [Actinomadura sp. WMMA1423]